MKTRIARFRIITLLLLITITQLTGCSGCSVKKASFTNTMPAIIDFNDTTYILTDEVISSEELGKQIGKITKVNAIVSYLEENDPYKNPNKIYKIKDIKSEDSIAVQVNKKFFKADKKE